jgi:hypothetical protein
MRIEIFQKNGTEKIENRIEKKSNIMKTDKYIQKLIMLHEKKNENESHTMKIEPLKRNIIF